MLPWPTLRANVAVQVRETSILETVLKGLDRGEKPLLNCAQIVPVRLLSTLTEPRQIWNSPNRNAHKTKAQSSLGEASLCLANPRLAGSIPAAPTSFQLLSLLWPWVGFKLCPNCAHRFISVLLISRSLPTISTEIPQTGCSASTLLCL